MTGSIAFPPKCIFAMLLLGVVVRAQMVTPINVHDGFEAWVKPADVVVSKLVTSPGASVETPQ